MIKFEGIFLVAFSTRQTGSVTCYLFISNISLDWIHWKRKEGERREKGRRKGKERKEKEGEREGEG